MALQYVDRVRVYTTTVGTGTLSLGSATTGFRTFANAVTAGALTSGATVAYMIEDIGNVWEDGQGIYTSGAETLTRIVTITSAGTTSSLSLSGSAQVYIAASTTALMTAAITSGAIDNAIIGSNTAASGAFATLSATGTSGAGFTALVAPYLTIITAANTYDLQSNPSNYITSSGAPVTSVFGRTGAVVMASTDIVTALGYTPANPLKPPDQGRNLIHNARFNVQQRGTGSWSGNGSYTADRWLISVSGDTISASIVTLTDADRAAIGDEFATSAVQVSVTGSATATNYSTFDQRIENVRELSGRTVTVSFWAKANVAINLGVGFQQVFGTGGGQVFTGGPTIFALTTSWVRYSTTVTISSASGQTFGTVNTDYTQLNFALSSGTNLAASFGVGAQTGTFTFFGVQLEIGSAATSLEIVQYGPDLTNCQRFYQIGYFVGESYVIAGVDFLITGTLPVQLRIAPANTAIGISTTNSVNLTGIAAGNVGGYAVYFYGVTSVANQTNLLIAFNITADL